MKSMKLMKYFKANFLLKSILIPIVLLIFYCLSYAFLHSLLFDQGVNYFFVIRLAKFASGFGGGVIGLILISFLIDRSQKLNLIHKPERFSTTHFILLLFPLTPVMQYILNNQEMLSLINALVVLGFFILFSIVYLFVIPILLRRISPLRLLTSVGVAFTFMILNMASLSSHFSWLKFGSIKVQFPLLVAIFLLVWMILGLKDKKSLIIIAVLFFMTNSIYHFISNVRQKDTPQKIEEETELQSMAVEREPVRTPNIYLLIYDAYVTNETMQSYGIDNSQQEEYLASLGFTLYPHTYSLGADTINTMSRVLNASTSYLGNARKAVSGSGVVQNTLKYLGYETYGVFPYDYMFRDVGSSYDVTIPETSQSTSAYLISAILTGEFRFDLFNIGFNNMDHEAYVQAKREIFNTAADNQVFIYTHSNIPNHSQNSGKCLPNEIELYAERLNEANAEMREDVEIILQNDPESIIIIAGDHGPYLTKNCTHTKEDFNKSEINRQDIQDRVGTFLTIKWQSQEFEAYDDITVLQDLFPAVFAYLYEDEAFLSQKVPSETLYSLSGVTVKDGIIHGGIHDGEPLFLTDN
jgi:hypothetical protein